MLNESNNWKEFEQYVAEIFSLLGYSIELDTKISSAQTDIIAHSKNRFKPNLIVECKFHENPSTKVGIDEVENFAARVVRLRNNGKIDQGYLVTNTGFTSSAKECITDSKTFVFLTTANQLINELIDIEQYLKDFCVEHQNTPAFNHFIDLKTCDIKNLGFSTFEYTTFLEDFALNAKSMIENNILIQYNTKDKEPKELFLKNDENLEDMISALVPSSSVSEITRRKITAQDINKITRQYESKILPFSRRSRAFLHGKNNLLLLLGDFGSGKTSCLSHLMYALAQEWRQSTNPVRIPLLISLRDYNKAVDIDALLNNFFATKLGNSNISLSVFHSLNAKGHFTLLLDGFDEMARFVTPVERRITFQEIAKIITPNTKAILSTRLGYFVDNDEIYDYINRYIKPSEGTYLINNRAIPENVEITCLQLMNNEQLSQFTRSALGPRNRTKLNRVLNSGSIMKMARRPVLANMIVETLSDIDKLHENEITLYRIYDIYTKKWIEREEDKGKFRILIDSVDKTAFLGLLAIQLYEQDKFMIHFKDLNKEIQTHFNLTETEKVDHFSHDIRACSFLARDDKGNYGFIHSSFMEFLIAKEFLKFSTSIYKGKFEKPFNNEILVFIQESQKPLEDKKIWLLFDRIKFFKNAFVQKQQYQIAAEIRAIERRYIENIIQKCWPNYDDAYTSIDDYSFQIDKFENILLEEKAEQIRIEEALRKEDEKKRKETAKIESEKKSRNKKK